MIVNIFFFGNFRRSIDICRTNEFDDIIQPFFTVYTFVTLFFDLRREAESNISFANSVIGLSRRRLRTSDDNDLEHVMNTECSLETGPFTTFRSPPTFYNLFKLFFYID